MCRINWPITNENKRVIEIWIFRTHQLEKIERIHFKTRRSTKVQMFTEDHNKWQTTPSDQTSRQIATQLNKRFFGKKLKKNFSWKCLPNRRMKWSTLTSTFTILSWGNRFPTKTILTSFQTPKLIKWSTRWVDFSTAITFIWLFCIKWFDILFNECLIKVWGLITSLKVKKFIKNYLWHYFVENHFVENMIKNHFVESQNP